MWSFFRATGKEIQTWGDADQVASCRNNLGGSSSSPQYQEAYSDEINNSNYNYLAFEMAINSTSDQELQKQIMATEMRMHEDVKGKPALKTMREELDMIEQDIRSNHQLAKDYGIPKEAERGTLAALKEHRRRLKNVISIMQSSQKELMKQRFQLERNKGKKNWF